MNSPSRELAAQDSDSAARVVERRPSLLAPALAPFAPAFVKRRLAADARPLTAPLAERWFGAALVADVSGFTALTEQLAELGDIGAEKLTNILNEFFGHAVAKIEAHGGDVARFAGDAMLVVWPCASEADLPQATRAAAACALDLHAPFSPTREEIDAPLAMKVAVGAGTISAMHLGGFLDRWEFLISGNAFQQAFAALKQTQTATSTVSLQAWRFLEGAFQAIPLSAGVMMLEDGPCEPQGAPLPEFDLPEGAAEALRSYVPAAVIDRLSAGQSRYLGELRLATALFVSLPELNYATPLDRAQAAMQYLQRELYRYEGAVNKLNVDEKGTALLAAFGLPPLAHEDDARRAVAASLAMQKRLRELGFDASIGAATGRVYCGIFGGEGRREYTLLGDTVNRAARLMQAAVGDILCDEATRQAAERSFQFDSLSHVTLKGKSAPLAVYRPVAPQGRTAQRGVELVGRQDELAQLDDELQTALSNQTARVAVVEGDPGVGKSRLLAEWLARTAHRGVECYFGPADALETSTLYFAWKPIFERLFGIDASTLPDAARQTIANLLDELAERAEWAPLLRAVLPIEIDDNDLTVHMTGRVRGENTRRLLAELLTAAARKRPLVVVLDDYHWLDSASWELIELAAQIPAGLFLVLGGRPLHPPLPAPFAKVVNSPFCSRVSLAPLSAEDALRLACRRLGVEDLPPPVADFIQRRAEGNALFTEEMAFALREAGQIEIVDGKCRLVEGVHELETLDFPDTLHGVITSRLDRLAPPEQLTVKVASVIGRHFAYQALRAIYPVESDRPRLRDHLGAALRTQLVEVEAPEPDLTYLFRHVIAQEAAYRLLLFHQREELHRAVAQWRESLDKEIPPQAFATMALHWRMANEPLRAVEYLERAGKHALESGGYPEAIGFYREAIELHEGHALELPAGRQAGWERRLGEAYLGLGRLAESRVHLLMSLWLHGHPAPRTPLELGFRLLGNVVRQFKAAAPAAPPGAAEDAASPHAVLLEVTRAYESLAEIHYLCNDKAPLVNALLANLCYAKRVGPSPELARAYANNCISTGLAGLHGLARRYADLAKSTGRQIDDPAAMAWVLEVTSLYALGAGQATEAKPDLEEAVAICRRLGDWRRWGENGATLAQGAYYCGEIDRGYRAWSELQHAAAARGDELQQAWGLNGCAEGLLRRHAEGDATKAVELLHEANALYERNVDRISQLGAWGLLAFAQARRGEFDAARQALAAGLALADEVGSPTGHYSLAGFANLVRASLWLWEHGPAPEAKEHARLAAQAQKYLARYARAFPIGRPAARLGRGTSLWLFGRFERAVNNWRRAIAQAAALRMPFEEALAHRELGTRLPDDDPRRAEHEQAALKLAEQMQIRLD